MEKGKGIEGVRLMKVQYIHRWNTMSKSACTMNRHLNNEGQDVNQVLLGIGY
jgi:hypothetical protein